MRTLAAVAVGVVTSHAVGVNVLVLSSTLPELDEAVLSALQSQGHTAQIGPPYQQLVSGDPLAGFDVVYLQANVNWIGDMPLAGQDALLAFVQSGGGLVTSEWVIWKVAVPGEFASLSAAFPAESAGAFNVTPETTYEKVVGDPILNEGLPDAFAFPNDDFGGTESYMEPRPGATEYYSSSTATAGVVGWDFGEGRALSVSSTAGASSITDAEFGLLLANAMSWAAGSGCVADCDASGSLNILDFVCFQQKFQSGDPAADINGDGVLNILDFVAFQQAFQQGCG